LTEEGGDPRFDAAPPLGEASCSYGEAGTGTDFASLFNDYFGPNAPSSCAGSPNACHGDPNSSGTTGSAGANFPFECPDQNGCYQSMRRSLLSNPSPRGTELYTVLRQCTQGDMPKVPPTFYFGPADMDRIAAWIEAGAPGP
jgi:hypothetical protein